MATEYSPGQAPRKGEELTAFLMNELRKISAAIGQLADGQLVKRHSPPERPRNGIYFADGTDWNPGAGAGLYLYDEDTATYTKL